MANRLLIILYIIIIIFFFFLNLVQTYNSSMIFSSSFRCSYKYYTNNAYRWCRPFLFQQVFSVTNSSSSKRSCSVVLPIMKCCSTHYFLQNPKKIISPTQKITISSLPSLPSTVTRSMSDLSRLGTNISERDSLGQNKIYFDGYTSRGVDVLGLRQSIPKATLVVANNEDTNSMVRVVGSFVAFPQSLYMWNSVTAAKDITLDTLAIFSLYEPKIDILLIGYPQGTPRLPPKEFNTIRQTLAKQRGVIVEQLDWLQACSTFNLLNGEDRNVAIAIVGNTQEDVE